MQQIDDRRRRLACASNDGGNWARVTHTYGKASRGPLGIYNFAGDFGKATFPAALALLLPVIAWRTAVGIMASVGMAVAVVLWVIVPRRPLVLPVEDTFTTKRRSGRGFSLLLTIGALDTATRMGLSAVPAVSASQQRQLQC